MAFRSDLDAVVLAVLESGPKHGYAILKDLFRHTNGLIKLGEGQLYPTLHKLETGGFVSAEWAAQEGKPARKVYSISTTGREHLAKLRRSWSDFRSGIDSVLKVS